MPSKKFIDKNESEESEEEEESSSFAEPKNKEKGNFDARNKKKMGRKQQQRDEIEQITSLYKTFEPESDSPRDSFDAFPLSQATLKGLKETKFTRPTDIQKLSLGHSILGKDVVGAAKTGSGKTLALLIPMLENLWRNRWTKFDGIGGLIITPTRELAFQIFQVLNSIGKYHEFSAALLIGGTDVEFERERLAAMNIVICTPGRLLQHMDENEHFSCDQLQILIIDEADRILDMGFRQQMDAIIENLPAQRQTLLFSATQTRRVEDLVRVSLKDPVFVSAHEHAAKATPDQLVQSYFVSEEEDKLNFLWSFLKNHLRKKTLVFVTCCKQARFITEAISHLRPGLYFTGLWGDLKQNKRMERFQHFDTNTKGAAMICTDVASRGLDFQRLDWVLQLDCPPSVEDYIHRVGRTARMNNSGEAMLMLTPAQEPFVRMLRERHVPISKVEVDAKKMLDIHKKLANLMVPFPELKLFAQKSFVAYARAVYFMKLKEVFNVQSINFEALAKSYGLPFTPRIRFLKKKGLMPKGDEQSEEIVLVKTATEDKNGFVEDEDEQDDEKDDEFLTLSRRDVFGEIKEVDVKEDILARISSKKPISKAMMAKKMVRRLGLVGKRKKFREDEEDEEEERREERRDVDEEGKETEKNDVEEKEAEKKDDGEQDVIARKRGFKKSKKRKIN